MNSVAVWFIAICNLVAVYNILSLDNQLKQQKKTNEIYYEALRKCVLDE